MSALRKSPSEQPDHWTDEITEAGEFDLTYKGGRLRTTAILAVATLTLLSFVGLAYNNAPLYAYLVASGTGVIFGLLVRRKPWPTKKESG